MVQGARYKLQDTSCKLQVTSCKGLEYRVEMIEMVVRVTGLNGYNGHNGFRVTIAAILKKFQDCGLWGMGANCTKLK